MKEVSLTNGFIAIIDDEDYDLVKRWNWYGHKEGGNVYAYTNHNKTCIKMHRIIMGALDGQIIDHIDGDGLNNQRNNLRFCTHAENSRNRRPNRNGTSKYMGVSWSKNMKKWRADISPGGKQISLGVFNTEEMAAKKFNEAAILYYGEFARLNIIE